MTLSLFDNLPAEAELPVFNPLSFDGGRCETCQRNRQAFCLSCYDRNGVHLPNRFVCGDCLNSAEYEARQAGSFERFTVMSP